VRANGIRLHYLDWGGDGPALLLLAGMGCSVHIFDRFARRFLDRFHVLALDRRGHGDSDCPESGYDAEILTEDLLRFLDALQVERVNLAGHSMSCIELCQMGRLYPERVLKLVFLDAVYDNASPDAQAVMQHNPLPGMIPAWPADDPRSFKEYASIVRRRYPALDAVWGAPMETQLRHTVRTTPDGRVVDRMPGHVAAALQATFAGYAPHYAALRMPVLAISCLRDGTDYLSSEYMTEEQRAQVLEYFSDDLLPQVHRSLERFRRAVPHARVLEIPGGHHYCFLKHGQVVVAAMRDFLQSA
jgi:pimeloyl-ACP methyl ester carboxylesterase